MAAALQGDGWRKCHDGPSPTSALQLSGSLFRDLGPYRDLVDHLGPYFSCFRLMYALKVTRAKPAICTQCRLCEVKFHFRLIITDYFQLGHVSCWPL